MSEAHRLSLRVLILGVTPTAIRVRRADGRGRDAWLPACLISIEDEQSDGTATLRITRALAETRGLL